MDEKEKRKDRNKRMLQAIAVTGGGALLVVIAFTLLIVFTANPKKSKEKEENPTQQRIDSFDFSDYTLSYFENK